MADIKGAPSRARIVGTRCNETNILQLLLMELRMSEHVAKKLAEKFKTADGIIEKLDGKLAGCQDELHGFVDSSDAKLFCSVYEYLCFGQDQQIDSFCGNSFCQETFLITMS